MMNREQMAEKIKDVEQGFAAYLPEISGYPSTVLEAMNYSLLAGGKRLRPVFMYETYRYLGGCREEVIRPFMMAIEMIHTYSLVHDDLPAMDNDDYRRGKLTTHKKYGEAMGILTGDALLNAAFETAFLAFDSEKDAKKIGKALQILGEKSGIRGMVGGQTVDVEKNGSFVDEETLYYVYKTKTAALIEASLMIGAVLAGADATTVACMEKIGTNIGIAFQIQDDILDVTGEEEMIGKPLHSDEKNDKSTYVSMHGVEKSRQMVKEYTNQGLELFDTIKGSDEETKEFIRDLFLSLVGREK
ncbi:MAG: polyprenyl synthetase family protein [Lachnospiraceae bacterium]|nr:polyprenyl synthetase family protein [Lachnospiraceae bacterium]